MNKQWSWYMEMSHNVEHTSTQLPYEAVSKICKYADLPRSVFIPYGALAYNPKDWDNGFERKFGTCKNSHYDCEPDVAQFACSVKDVDVIKQFFELVVATTFLDVETFQVMYEYEPNVQHWQFIPSKWPLYTIDIRPDYAWLYGEPESHGY